MATQPSHAPQEITVDRQAGAMVVVWAGGHESRYPLTWLRTFCPCATCREERRKQVSAESALHAALDRGGELSLNSSPPPSDQIAGAELVGGYALRLSWQDGHDTGIYAFSSLRTSCPCLACNPEGPPPLLAD